MLFWIATALMAVGVTWALTRPLLGERNELRDAGDADIAVYKDQLAEIETDRARGALPATEAEQARAEIARRLLRKPITSETAAASSDVGFIKPTYLTLTLALPVVSLALYLAVGAPGMPGQPLDERLGRTVENATTNDLVARVEARLRDLPEDGRGWDAIAPVYYSLGRYEEAASAFATAIRILGETPTRLQGFANARIRASNGIVPEDARAAMEQVLKVEPQRPEPRIWLALAKEQDGKKSEAISDYRALLKDAPSDAPWKGFLEERIAGLEGTAPANAPAAENEPGPGGMDPATIAAMSQQERQDMINQMVSRLAERMKTTTHDAEGWLKLIRAYQTLGRKDDALKALSEARAGLKADETGLKSVNELARQLGLEG